MFRALRRLRLRPFTLVALGLGLLATPPAGAQTPIVSAVPVIPSGSFAVVTREDGTVFSAISEAQFDRFFDAALSQAQGEPVAKLVPLVPPLFSACVDADPGATHKARWRACASEYATVRNTAAQQLINLTWTMAEADRRGMVFTDRRVAREIRTIADEQFDGPRGLRRFMRDSGLRNADIRLNLVAKLAQDAIVRQLSEPWEAAANNDASTTRALEERMRALEEQQRAIEAFRTAFYARWGAATTCAPYFAKLPACAGDFRD